MHAIRIILGLCSLFTMLPPHADAQSASAGEPSYARPHLMQQFVAGKYKTNNLELRQYALSMFEVLDARCGAPDAIRMAAGRLRASIETIGADPRLSDGARDAQTHHAAHGCGGAGQRLKINVMRYISQHQEAPRSLHYDSQPASLFNACVRDRIRANEAGNEWVYESSIRTWCECAVHRIERYVTREDRVAFLKDFNGYLRELRAKGGSPLLFRLNACAR